MSSFAAFGPRNYRLMGLGLAVLAAGFITMTLDKADYGEGFLGITLGPILLLVGFVMEFFAIMLRDPAAGAAIAVTLSDAAPVAAPPVPTPRPSYKPL